MSDPSEETPAEKQEPVKPYGRGSGPNPAFHDYGIGNLKRIEQKEEKPIDRRGLS